MSLKENRRTKVKTERDPVEVQSVNGSSSGSRVNRSESSRDIQVLSFNKEK